MPRLTFLILLACKVTAITLLYRQLWLAAAVVWFLSDFWVLYHLFVPSAQGLCRNFTYFETTAPEVWLTIDDGPDPVDTPQLLDLLDQHMAKATFFVIGQRAAQHPALLAEILQRGHEIGHHTQTHPHMTFWCASKSRVQAELDATLDILRGANARVRWFRPPVGIKNLFLSAALATRHLRCLGWSVRSGDCLSRSTDHVVAKVMRHVRPGAIILMHEGPSVSAPVRIQAIAGVLKGLATNRYRCILPDPHRLR